jgi:hypothetical protein
VRRYLLAAAILWPGALDAAEPPPAPSSLRTLFHSAAEREKLDRARRGEPVEEASTASPRRAPPAVTGFVKRSDGRDTVWLDGRPVTGAEAKRLAESAKSRDGAEANHGIEVKRSR